MSNWDQPLSSEGLRRREQILAAARRVARRRRWRRRALRGGDVIAVVAILVTLYVQLFPKPTARQPRPTGPIVHQPDSLPSPTATPVNAIVITWIATDPTLVDRLAIDPHRPRIWRSIDDEELIQTLAEAGQHAGIIRMNDQAILLTRADVARAVPLPAYRKSGSGLH
ncbi:hypothetical protein [Fontivita pretiosa]|uniref:hypothetical protein n=1 Tax=Fontivita pretiosa TaxID=2989684 RepID=UPI003D17A7B9